MKLADIDFTPQSSALIELRDRGFIEEMSDPRTLDRRLADRSQPLRFYIGYDPTARSLHAGNLVCIMAMRILQRHGHAPIVLLGGGTARVGDPSGRSDTRKMLDEATTRGNLAGISRQFEQFLQFAPDHGSVPDHAARVVDNSDWLLAQSYIEFLRDIGSHFTVNRMLSSKTYRDRLDAEQPLSFLEFNYQLLQAFDFLHLYRDHECTLQMGGSDQWGNMIAGVELIRRLASVNEADRARMSRQGPAQCLTFPLLTTADGRKMGKTETGAVWLDPAMLAPFDYYQYWIGIDDRDVRTMLLKFTDLPLGEVEELCAVEGAALRAAKQRLALEATALCHGEDEAKKAQTAAHQAFGGSDDWSAVPAIQLDVANVGLLDLLVDPRVNAFASKRQARQRIEGGAIKVDGNPVKDPATVLQASSYPDGSLRLQAGKKHRIRVIFG